MSQERFNFGHIFFKGVKMARKKLVTGTWTLDQVKILKKEFPNSHTAEVAEQLNRSIDTVKKKASRMGIKKSKRYLKTLGRA